MSFHVKFRLAIQKLTVDIGPDPGDVGSSPGSGDSIAGAAGTDNGSISISRGGIIAIIIVAVSVCVLGSKFRN